MKSTGITTNSFIIGYEGSIMATEYLGLTLKMCVCGRVQNIDAALDKKCRDVYVILRVNTQR